MINWCSICGGRGVIGFLPNWQWIIDWVEDSKWEQSLVAVCPSCEGKQFAQPPTRRPADPIGSMIDKHNAILKEIVGKIKQLHQECSTKPTPPPPPLPSKPSHYWNGHFFGLGGLCCTICGKSAREIAVNKHYGIFTPCIPQSVVGCPSMR